MHEKINVSCHPVTKERKYNDDKKKTNGIEIVSRE